MRQVLRAMLLVFLFAFVPTVLAKRSAPAPVKPAEIDGVRYSAVSEQRLHKDEPAALVAYIKAQNIQSGAELWKLPIYEVRYEAGLEKDVQDVHITAIEPDGANLIIRNESKQEFLLDRKSGTVRGLIRR